MRGISCRQARADEVIDLRHRLLRAGLPRESAVFPGDELSSTVHCVAEADGRIICCVTLMLSEWKGTPAWQLRGMATDSDWQGKGVGARIVAHALDLARRQSPQIKVFWCNARIPARRFYEKIGWKAVGEVFEIPTAGPHIRMAFAALESRMDEG